MTNYSLWQCALPLLLVVLSANWLPAVAQPSSGKSTRPPTLVVEDGHPGGCYSLCFSPDGQYLATGGAESTKLWNARSGRLLATLHEPGQKLLFTPDSRQLWIVGRGRSLTQWDCETASQLPSAASTNTSAQDIALDSDGGLLIAQEQTLGFLPGSKHRPVDIARTLKAAGLPTQEIVGLQSGNDPSRILLHVKQKDMSDHRIAIVDLPNRRVTCIVPLDGYRYGADKNITCLGIPGFKETVIWDLSANKSLASLPTAASAVAISDDKQSVATADKNMVTVWDLSSRAARRSIVLPHRVSDLSFSPDGSSLAVGTMESSQGEFILWDIHSGSLLPLGRSVGNGAAAVSSDRRHLATSGRDGVVRVYDLENSRQTARLKVDSPGFAGPLAFLGKDLLAGSTRLTLWDVDTGGKILSLGKGVTNDVTDVAGYGLVLASQANGKSQEVAIGTLDSQVRWWRPDGSLAHLSRANFMGVQSVCQSPDGRFTVTVGSDTKALVFQDGEVKGELTETAQGPLPQAGSAGIQSKLDHADSGLCFNSAQFSADGQLLALGDQRGCTLVYAFNSQDPSKSKLVDKLRVFGPAVKVIRFVPGTQNELLVAYASGEMVHWTMGTAPVEFLQAHDGEVGSLEFLSPGLFVTASPAGGIKFWSLPSTAQAPVPLATLTEFPGNDWIVVTPEGYFDGTPAAWSRVHWYFESVHSIAEPEQFFRDFFQPGLLHDITTQAKPFAEILKSRGQLTKSLETLDRRQPVVVLESLASQGQTDSVDLRLSLHSQPANDVHADESGVRDARLFRNGLLVKRWPGILQNGSLPPVKVPLVPGDNRFAAYAFSNADIKSKDSLALTVAGPAKTDRQPQVHILAVGVDEYADPTIGRLGLARRDAKDLSAALADSLGALYGQERVHRHILLDKEATRSGILSQLDRLAQEADPQDTVIVSFSCHGAVDHGKFYLLTHDSCAESPGLSPSDIETAFLGRESETLSGLQAQNLLLVLDCCHSGAVLDGAEWRQGPLNSRGFAQLAYEKGVLVLAASQADEVAIEGRTPEGKVIDNGLLTYALLEALKNHQGPKPQLGVTEWLDASARRLIPSSPSAQPGNVEVTRGAHRINGASVIASPIQRPRLFLPVAQSDWPVAIQPAVRPTVLEVNAYLEASNVLLQKAFDTVGDPLLGRLDGRGITSYQDLVARIPALKARLQTCREQFSLLAVPPEAAPLNALYLQYLERWQAVLAEMVQLDPEKATLPQAKQFQLDMTNKQLKADQIAEARDRLIGTNRGAEAQQEESLKFQVAQLNLELEQTQPTSGTYLKRADAKRKLQDKAGALEDTDRAVALEPENGKTYRARGHIKRAFGDYRGALADFDRAISKEETSQLANSVTQLCLAEGRAAALAGEQALVELGWADPNGAYAAIFTYWGYRQAGDEKMAADILARASARAGSNDWPFPIIQYLGAQISEQKLLDQAIDPSRMTEARTSLGLAKAMQGQREDALVDFRWVVEHGDRTLEEFDLAVSQLHRLESAATPR